MVPNVTLVLAAFICSTLLVSKAVITDIMEIQNQTIACHVTIHVQPVNHLHKMDALVVTPIISYLQVFAHLVVVSDTLHRVKYV
jgi:hypothetical protein